MSAKTGDVLVESKPVVHASKNNTKPPVNNDYLDEYDEYFLDNEKYFLGGQGGKQRTKKDIVQNVKHDPSGNVRLITSKLHNFEHNRRKESNEPNPAPILPNNVQKKTVGGQYAQIHQRK